MPRHVVVVGCSGAMGRLFVRTLAADGATLTGIDMAPCALANDLDEFFCTDATSLSGAAEEAVTHADWVIVCLPEEAALAGLPRFTALLRPGALWVDTLSVKQRVCAALAKATSVESLSINPLFAPDLGFHDQNVAVVELNAGANASAFLQRLKAAGASLVTLSAAEHDRYTSVIQVATHALLLAFGAMLDMADYDVRAALRLSTPPHRLLLSLLHRVTSGDPLLYWEIQRNHSLASRARESLIAALTELDRFVAEARADDFVASFARTRQRIAAAAPFLDSITRGALEAARRRGHGP